MKRKLLTSTFLIILAIPAEQWTVSITSPWFLFEHQLPPGQWCYLLSKLVAQYAFLFLTAQIILGLLLAHKANSLLWLGINLHRNAGIIVLVFTVLHAGLFITAIWLRSGHFPSAVLGLHFDQGYYNFYVSIGLLTASLLFIVAIIGLGRKRFPTIVFHYGHRLAWLVWALGFWHSIAIGTETNGGVMWSWFYIGAAALVGLLMIYRIYQITIGRIST